MHEREPLRLLTPLSETLASKGLPLAGAVFVPPDSTYAKLGPSEEPAATIDLSWQQGLAQLWRENFAAATVGKEAKGSSSGGAATEASSAAAAAKLLPPLPTNAAAGAANAAAPTGAVAPSVRSALEWLRSATRASPGLKMRVLVTGSLYLVGDVLRHLGKNDE